MLPVEDIKLENDNWHPASTCVKNNNLQNLLNLQNDLKIKYYLCRFAEKNLATLCCDLQKMAKTIDHYLKTGNPYHQYAGDEQRKPCNQILDKYVAAQLANNEPN